MVIRHVDDYDDDRNPKVNVSVSVTVNVTSQPLHQESTYAVTASPPAEQFPALYAVPSATPAPGPFVTMTLDGGLPCRLEFTSDWHERVAPKDVGDELFEAYQDAMNERHGRHSASHSSARSGLLSAREQAIMLLETRTWNKYCRIQDDLLSDGNYLIRGATTQYAKPVLSMTGNRESIHSITVSPLWPGCTNPRVLEKEVLWCADRIRDLRPKFAPTRDWSSYSDEELFDLQRRHRRQLMQNNAL
ncbi:hypothetical protein [Nocardia inohanensis]|uniref:hypothetical protein n=1 Tax=Nocardia inohanensis TaxID=209246 RepID=UPI00082D300B|nr:hypothetical protein [Nocardia inohanensis]